MICNDCARNCNVDLSVSKGFCGKQENKIRVAKIMRHMWEEPIISGKKGSGAIFFSYCSLKCVYCQNYKISHMGQGTDFSIEQFADILKKLDESDVENINLVTPTHYTSQILEAFKIYKPKKPIVWNTSGYENNLERLKGVVDIFLFDLKYFDEELSKKYSSAKDYFKKTMAAIKQAKQFVGEDIVQNNILKKGVIVRHLILPCCAGDSTILFDCLKNELGTDINISLMSQYVPCYKAEHDKDLNRKITKLEYKKVLSHITNLGFNKGFVQDFSSAKKDYTPEFCEEKLFEI